jgi:hypothetical protein
MENANCLGGNVISVREGYWRLNEESETVQLCPAKRACKGGTDVTRQCRKGHKGMYCSVCKGTAHLTHDMTYCNSVDFAFV